MSTEKTKDDEKANEMADLEIASEQAEEIQGRGRSFLSYPTFGGGVFVGSSD